MLLWCWGYFARYSCFSIHPRELRFGRKTKTEICREWNTHLSIIPEIPSKRAHWKGIPKFSKAYLGTSPFHSILDRKSWKFWLHGKRLMSTCPWRHEDTSARVLTQLPVSIPPPFFDTFRWVMISECSSYRNLGQKKHTVNPNVLWVVVTVKINRKPWYKLKPQTILTCVVDSDLLSIKRPVKPSCDNFKHQLFA